jgi:hypothetical protein
MIPPQGLNASTFCATQELRGGWGAGGRRRETQNKDRLTTKPRRDEAHSNGTKISPISQIKGNSLSSIGTISEIPASHLRTHNGFVTDGGSIKLYRRKAESHWLETLPPLIEFLGPRGSKSLSLEHIDRVA